MHTCSYMLPRLFFSFHTTAGDDQESGDEFDFGDGGEEILLEQSLGEHNVSE